MWLSTEYQDFIIRKRDDKWLDFVSNGLRPISIGQHLREEALMFRVFIDENNQVSIKIHWDNGKNNLINPGDNARLRGFIATYYPWYTENEQELRRKQQGDLQRMDVAIPVMRYWMKLICCDIGVRIADCIGVEKAADELDEMTSVHSQHITDKEIDLHKKRKADILKTILDISTARYREMNVTDKLRVQHEIQKILSKEENGIEINAKSFVDALECERVSLPRKPKQLVLGMIRKDFDVILSHILSFRPSDKKLIHTSFCRRVLRVISGTLAKIVHHCEGYELCVRQELARLLRLVIQYIFRMHHDA